MNDRTFCPPSTIGGEFSNNFGHQEHVPMHDPFINGFSNDSSSGAIPTQNGHFQQQRGIQGTTMQPYRETSPMKPLYQQGSVNFAPHPPPPQTSYANITASKAGFDPYGYRSQRSVSYNIQQQRSPNFITGSRQSPANFVEEQHSRSSVGFGGFPPHPPSNSGTFGARQSPHQPSFLPNGIPPFQPTGSQRPFQQQHFSSVGLSGQQVPDFSTLPAAGTNLDMMMFEGMNGTGNGGNPIMNGTTGAGEDFPAEFGIQGDMPAQYVLSNELLCRIDNSPNKQALLELQIGLEQIAYEASMNFNTWATVIKDRMTGREKLAEPDMRITAEMLVEMSVVLDESQYNFSRLCQFLCSNIDNLGQNVLLPQVSSFVTETNTFLSSQHLRNLVTFLAELYDKIAVKGVKSSQLAAHLFDQLQNLLKLSPMDDQTIGVIVKTLKLVGRFLENDRGPQAMDDFFSELAEASQSSSNSAKDKVQNLATLRGKHWGIVAETSLGGNSSAFPSLGILGPDGEQLTEDECNFLDDNFDNFGNSPSGSLYNPMEEDNVEDDYEQFLQATAIRAAEKALEKVSIDEDDESVVSSPKFPIGKQ